MKKKVLDIFLVKLYVSIFILSCCGFHAPHLYCDDGAYDAAFCSRFGHTEDEILLDDNLGVSSKMVAFVRPKEMKKKAEEL